MVIVTLLLLMLFPAAPMSAAQQPVKVDLDAWITINYIVNPDYHFTLVVLESDFTDTGDPVLSDVSAEIVGKNSMLRLVDSRSLAWDLKLNASKISGATVREKLEKLTDATYYLFVPCCRPCGFL